MIPQLQQETPVSSAETVPQWSLGTKVIFRFVLSYFLLYVYPAAVGSLGAGTEYHSPLKTLWYAVVPWVGTHVLHLTGNFNEVANGSGDQLYDYVLLFCIAVTAVVATAVWSVLDRKRPNYETLYQWFRVFMRMMVAVAMISYGANKLFRMQFPTPSLARYVDSYGRTTPMGLLWTMMGYSRAYSFFGGAGEMLGGLLLLVPRLTSLGCLVTLGVMSNVLMLNFAYDVPRKIYCIHLMAFCMLLLIPDMRKIFDFFLLNRKEQLTPPAPLFKDKMMNYGIVAMQVFIGVGALCLCLYSAYQDQLKNEAKVPEAIRGIWSVNEFALNNVPHAPLVTDDQRWRYIILDGKHDLVIQTMDGTQKKYYLDIDMDKRVIGVWVPPDKHRVGLITFDYSTPNNVRFQGDIEGNHISAETQREDLSDPNKFLLMNRGVHWVTDYPHNR